MADGAATSSVHELLEWVSARQRTYKDAQEAWGTHCPRHSAWEDAIAAGLIEVRRNGSHGSLVALTAAGESQVEASAVEAEAS